MKTVKTYATGLLAATLVAGALFGCGGQPQPAQQEAAEEPAATESATESATTDAASTKELADELKAAMKAASSYQSLTLTRHTVMDDDENQVIDAVAKFDVSGERTISSITYTTKDSTYATYYDGQDMVCDFGDGDVFKVTADELDEDEEGFSVESLAPELLGHFEAIVDSAGTITKAETDDGGVVYELELDPKLLAEHDAELSDMGIDVDAVAVSYEFGADGRLAKIATYQDMSLATVDETIVCSDYDSTVVDPAPETDRTLADHQAELEE